VELDRCCYVPAKLRVFIGLDVLWCVSLGCVSGERERSVQHITSPIIIDISFDACFLPQKLSRVRVDFQNNNLNIWRARAEGLLLFN
jgi:hypothetical protein